jgi:hypothetical protein
MGPDMGMFPGGEPLFSDLAHYVRSGELTRTLIHTATSDLERAFAWGWATHVLADAMIHPLVNIAAGDARGSGPLTYADDPGLHLAVEIGADGDRFAQWQQLALPRQTQPESGIAEHLTRSYHTVYGPVVTAKQVKDSLGAWFRWHRFSIALAGAAAANLYGRNGGRHGLSGGLRRLAKLLTGLFSRQSLVHALTHPIAPSERANALIGQAIRDYPEQFRELERDRFATLPDYNLDTGTVEEGITYPLTTRTLAEMRKRTNSVLSPTS